MLDLGAGLRSRGEDTDDSFLGPATTFCVGVDVFPISGTDDSISSISVRSLVLTYLISTSSLIILAPLASKSSTLTPCSKFPSKAPTILLPSSSSLKMSSKDIWRLSVYTRPVVSIGPPFHVNAMVPGPHSVVVAGVMSENLRCRKDFEVVSDTEVMSCALVGCSVIL